jgi:hypothetical protein
MFSKKACIMEEDLKFSAINLLLNGEAPHYQGMSKLYSQLCFLSYFVVFACNPKPYYLVL